MYKTFLPFRNRNKSPDMVSTASTKRFAIIYRL